MDRKTHGKAFNTRYPRRLGLVSLAEDVNIPWRQITSTAKCRELCRRCGRREGEG